MNPPVFQLAVVNPGGSDSEQAFPDGAGAPDDRVHAPVNYHAYAACNGGVFYKSDRAVPDGQRAVLLLIRRDVHACFEALERLQARGITVAVSLKESGSHQFAGQFADTRRLEFFQKICARCDGALSSTPELVPIYRGAGVKVVEFIPTPYPVDDPRWDFSVPVAERRGIFIGTRELDVPSRNHLAALLAAKSLTEPITVLNLDGRAGQKRLKTIAGESLNIVENRLPYSAYLRELARHRLVWQLDRSAVPGQVAGDALLCRLPCVGGDGAVDRIAFPESHGFGRNTEELVACAARLLADPRAYERSVAGSQQAARQHLSFAAGAARLADFFARLRAP